MTNMKELEIGKNEREVFCLFMDDTTSRPVRSHDSTSKSHDHAVLVGTCPAGHEAVGTAGCGSSRGCRLIARVLVRGWELC